MVDRSLSLVAAHELSHQVKDAILAAGLDVIDVNIHIEPLERTGCKFEVYGGAFLV